MPTQREISKATIGRIPVYLQYLRSLPPETVSISATALAKELHLGEVQVRKDLGAVSGAGKPKIGYQTAELIRRLEAFLAPDDSGCVILLGAGKLGRALLDYSGFAAYGLEIAAAFDVAVQKPERSAAGKQILPLSSLCSFCRTHPVSIGILTVPADAAQEACDRLIDCGVRAIWSFAPCTLRVPKQVQVRYENMALSLAHLKTLIQKNV